MKEMINNTERNIFDEIDGVSPDIPDEYVPEICHDYDDIINLRHPEPRFPRKRMSMEKRAAQFSPFEALGSQHREDVWEAQRLTEQFIELTEAEKTMVNTKLQNVLSYPNVPVEITYFIPDDRKQGGAYNTVTGTIKKVDQYSREIIMEDSRRIPLDMLFDINSDVVELY